MRDDVHVQTLWTVSLLYFLPTSTRKCGPYLLEMIGCNVPKAMRDLQWHVSNLLAI